MTPANGDAWQRQAQQGLAALRQGDAATAAQALDAAHTAKPGHPGVAAALAAARTTLGQPAAALAALAAVDPASRDIPDWHHQRGLALVEQGDHGNAEAAFRRAVELDPDSMNERHQLAQAQARQHKLAAAEATYRAALDHAEAIAADSAAVARLWHNLGRLLRDHVRAAEACACFRTALAWEPALEAAYTQLLLALHYDPWLDRDSLFQAHRDWRDRFYGHLDATTRAPAMGPADKAPLIVGILSGELRRHPQLWLYLRAFENLDPAVVRLYVYDFSAEHDVFTHVLATHAALWRHVASLTEDGLAAQMRADGVDILLNKAGHVEGRVGVCAYRPAPVQVQWGGFNTTGLDAVDWFLGDQRELPPGDEPYFTESLYRLPDGYVVYRGPPEAPPVGELPMARSGQVTFACFNNPAKVNERVAGLWGEILRHLPHSRLYLKGKAFADPEVAQSLRARLVAAGVPVDQLVLEGPSSHGGLLACYQAVDIALDPWPYSGGLTTIEALWMGVPTVTLPGNGFVGRHAASHLANAGLGDWIAADGADYIAKAVAWARAPAALGALRAGLRAQVAASPLCDGPRFARNLEAALRDMWQRQAVAS